MATDRTLQSVTRIRRAETADRMVRLNFHPNLATGWRGVEMAVVEVRRPARRHRLTLDIRDTQLRTRAEVVAAQLAFTRALEEAAEN